MTDTNNPTGVHTKEVSLYDKDGYVYEESNPLQIKDTLLNSLAQTMLTLWQSIDIVQYEGFSSLQVVQGHSPSQHIHLSVDNQSGSKGYMLVDLSNTTTFPHTNTGHLLIKYIVLDIDPSSAFTGDVLIGFLSNVDGTNGDFNQIAAVHAHQLSPPRSLQFDFSLHGMDLEEGEWLGPKILNSTVFQTDVNLLGPDGLTNHPAGNGDLVALLTSTAGTVDLSVTVSYISLEA